MEIVAMFAAARDTSIVADDAELLVAARAGEARAFERLVAPHVSSLRSFIFRMVMNRDDAEDIAQEVMLQAYEKFATFRGEATVRTWLFSIAARRSIDHLRARGRWPASAQTQGANEHVRSPDRMRELREAASDPEFEYDYREHVAYCFSCIGRSLEPEEAAALFLRDVFDLSNEEAAQAMELSLSTFRHRLASARQTMIDTYRGLCALVTKRGTCWQCDGLRDALPEEHRGQPVAPLGAASDSDERLFRRRLAIVREASFADGTGATPLHDYLVRYMMKTFDAR